MVVAAVVADSGGDGKFKKLERIAMGKWMRYGCDVISMEWVQTLNMEMEDKTINMVWRLR